MVTFPSGLVQFFNHEFCSRLRSSPSLSHFFGWATSRGVSYCLYFFDVKFFSRLTIYQVPPSKIFLLHQVIFFVDYMLLNYLPNAVLFTLHIFFIAVMRKQMHRNDLIIFTDFRYSLSLSLLRSFRWIMEL